jgi:3',5'-cyclic AMP phosphodiesterase CpdA
MRYRFLLSGLLAAVACAPSHGVRPPERMQAAALPSQAMPERVVPEQAPSPVTASPPSVSTGAALAAVTTVRSLRPARPRAAPDEAKDPAHVSVRNHLEQEGAGALLEGPGEAPKERHLGGAAPPLPGPRARRLARFVHLTDAHIADDESPGRGAAHDAPGPKAGALRPQEAELCQLLDAAVRTINALHRADPIDFVLLGGDNTDNAQANELSWLLAILGGSPRVKCDSGRDDDPRPGPGNDGKDAFVAEGLAVPWRWVTGNHDVLLQGSAILDLGLLGIAGAYSPAGTRDYARGGEIFTGEFVVPDDGRALLRRRDLLGRVLRDGDGHGLTPAQVEAERASYSFDAGGARFVVLDTAAETGGHAGLLRAPDAGQFLEEPLEAASRDGAPVVLVAHHPYDVLTPDGGRFGQRHPGALDPPAFLRLVAERRAVAFSIDGHSHRHRVRAVATPGGGGFWELTTGSLADFPHQFRLLELWDQDNGWLTLKSRCVDVVVEGNAPAQLARERGVIDYVTGYSADGPGGPDDRNVDLWAPRPRRGRLGCLGEQIGRRGGAAGNERGAAPVPPAGALPPAPPAGLRTLHRGREPRVCAPWFSALS